MARKFGLIGFPLTHSFSKRYFTNKFIKEERNDCSYELFEIKDPSEVVEIIGQDPELEGLNVTIPHKESVIKFLDKLEINAERIGAVNVIKIRHGQTTGYNSDYDGFKESLINWLGHTTIKSALILGTGGASKAIDAVLEDLNVEVVHVSRSNKPGSLSYSSLESSKIIADTQLLINTTPLGMHPNLKQAPSIPYDQISSRHFVYDVIYNPAQTLFLKKAAENGAKTKNGEEMLKLQADRSWEIWNA